MNTSGISEGMVVRTNDGEKLGKIVADRGDGFIIEKGFFFRKDYVARYEDVASVRDGEVLLRHSASSLREGIAAPDTGRNGGPEMGRPAAAPPPSTISAASEELRIPVAEEEITAEKRTRQAGEVKIRKEVKTEHRQISVPVMKEEVHVERVPAGADARPGDATFQAGTFTVPVHEEEVEIRKRPVIREEVRVSKRQHQEERRADATVRKEVVQVDRGEAGMGRRGEHGGPGEHR